MLGQRHRRWLSIKPALGQRLLFYRNFQFLMNEKLEMKKFWQQDKDQNLVHLFVQDIFQSIALCFDQ